MHHNADGAFGCEMNGRTWWVESGLGALMKNLDEEPALRNWRPRRFILLICHFLPFLLRCASINDREPPLRSISPTRTHADTIKQCRRDCSSSNRLLLKSSVFPRHMSVLLMGQSAYKMPVSMATGPMCVFCIGKRRWNDPPPSHFNSMHIHLIGTAHRQTDR